MICQRFRNCDGNRGNLPVTGGFPSKRVSDALFYLNLILALIHFWTISRVTGNLRHHDANVTSLSLIIYFCQQKVIWNHWYVQYIPKNMHTVFALLCFVVVIHWLIFPYPSGLLHWHCGNLTIAPVPAKQPWWIWINTSCDFIMNDCVTTTKQSTTKPCAYFLGYTVERLWRKLLTL